MTDRTLGTKKNGATEVAPHFETYSKAIGKAKFPRAKISF